MGRTVSRPYRASFTHYFPVDVPEGDEDDSQFYFDQMLEDLRGSLTEAFPSVSEADRWAGREEHVIAGNRHGDFVLCEYMGLCSLSFVPNDSDEHAGLAANWGSSIEQRVARLIPNRLVKLGTFSNGEAVYQRAA